MSFQGVTLIPQIKEDWIKALRSGKYVQAHKALCIKDGGEAYCCLGVLAKVKGIPLVNEDKQKDGFIPAERGTTRFDFTDRFPDPYRDLRTKMLCDCLLPEEWFSMFFISDPAEIMDTTHSDHTSNGLQGLLAEMNDSGNGFPEIADWIEKNL